MKSDRPTQDKAKGLGTPIAELRKAALTAKRQAKLAKLRYRKAKLEFKEAKRLAKALRRKLKEAKGRVPEVARSPRNPKAAKRAAVQRARNSGEALELKLSQIQTRAALMGPGR